jgi:hypothetical protein
VLRLAEQNDEAAAALAHALELYEVKGHAPFADRARTALAELRDT